MKRTQIGALAPTRKRALLFSAAAALILIVMLANYLSPRNVPSVDPTVSIEREQNDDTSNPRTANVIPNLPDDGEVYRTAERLRVASAVALAAGLYVAGEQVNRRYPQSADSLIAGVRSTSLLPPGITVAGRAMLLSPFGRIQLRFRADPLAIEVIDIPHSREDGPALMVRIPGSGPEGERGSVFIADRLGDINLPIPFASLSDCVRAGWIDQPIIQSDTPQEQEQQLRVWLATRRPR
ncbi:MAG TPA: hypothetical protein VNS63_21015 [Blastocatellia bacterium]|nr:hypothetical protein [Blastocatellia bacterium]